MIQAYTVERNKFVEYKTQVSNFYAKIIVRKLARHFKLNIVQIDFYGTNDSGRASLWGRIRLSNVPSLGIICHEVNHFLCWKKYGTSKGKAQHGSRKWYVQLKRVIRYCRTKNFWKEEYDRRTAPKPMKPEPTKQEVRLRKIARFEKAIKRHQTRIKRCQTAIKRNDRRIAGLKRFI